MWPIRKKSDRGEVGAQRLEPSPPGNSVRVVIAQKPDSDELTLIQNWVLNYNVELAGPPRYQNLAAFLRGPDGRVLGGVTGSTYWGWLEIDFLWVSKGLRGRGHGTKLLAAAEDQARERDCHHACVETFTFQAATGFYEKFGYTRFGSLPDFPFGNQRIFFYKPLVE